MTLRAMVVDDEAPARRRLRRLLLAEPDIVVSGECGDGASAVNVIGRDRPDLVFLDVQMPERNGFEVVAELPSADRPSVVFVTAHDRYALRAFDVHAVDYLLKPFTRERFRVALERARDRIARRAPDEAVESLVRTLRDRQKYRNRVAVKSAGRTCVIDLASVDWIQAADNYVRLHVQSREYLLRETLASLEAELDPARFVRIHRSSIVPIDRVATLTPASHGDAEVVLRDGTRLTASRTWRDRLRRLLD